MKSFPTYLKREIEETNTPKTYYASAVGIAPCYVSQYLTGTRQPPPDVVRKTYALFLMIREEFRTEGGFAFNSDNLQLLRKQLDKMQKSIVPSNRPQPKPLEATEGVREKATCAKS